MNLVEVWSYSLESTEQCDVSDSHPGEVSFWALTVITHIKQNGLKKNTVDIWLIFFFLNKVHLDLLSGGDVQPDADSVGYCLLVNRVALEVPPVSSASAEPSIGCKWHLRLRWCIVGIVVAIIVVVIFSDGSCGGRGRRAVAVGFRRQSTWLPSAASERSLRVYLTFPSTVTLIATLLQRSFGSSRW